LIARACGVDSLILPPIKVLGGLNLVNRQNCGKVGMNP